jgi:hypothetical protein
MLAVTLGCATSSMETGRQRTTIAPARPLTSSSTPWVEPPLSRPTMHLTVTKAGLEALLDVLVPRSDGGDYAFLGARSFRYERGPFSLAFDDARKAITATTSVTATVDVPGAMLTVPLSVTADMQPILTADHRLALQAVTVKVTSNDHRVRLADAIAGLVVHVEKALQEQLAVLAVDLRPAFSSIDDTLGAPVFLPLSPAQACFHLDVRAWEAGPAVFAQGFERDLALTVAPSLTLPCALRDAGGTTIVVHESDVAERRLPPRPPLPPLKNVSGIEGGPFVLTIPIAAGYDELRKAATLAFVDGRLFFSQDHPGLFIAEPELFASEGAVIVRVRLGGFATIAGVRVDVDGELFLSGRPSIEDDVIAFHDLDLTLASEQALIQTAFAVKKADLNVAVQRALRFDLGSRLQTVRQKVESALNRQTVVVAGVPALCTRVDIGRLAVTELSAHDAYLRATVATTALLSASLPCPQMTSLPAAQGISQTNPPAGPVMNPMVNPVVNPVAAPVATAQTETPTNPSTEPFSSPQAPAPVPASPP